MNLNQGILIASVPPPEPLVAISDQNVDDGLNTSATYRLRNTGVADVFTELSGSFTPIPGEWLLSGVVGDYQVMWHQNSGDAPSVVGPAADVWGSFTLQLNLSAGKACNLTVSIRLASTQEVLDTATIIINTTA